MAEKQLSQKEQYVEHIQGLMELTLGVKVSKAKVWDFIKDFNLATMLFTLKQPKETLSLAGVAKHRVVRSTPRGAKAGLDAEGKKIDGAKVWDFVPRYRVKVSSKMENILEQVLGQEDHAIEVPDYFAQIEALKAEKPAKPKAEKQVKPAKEEPKAEQPKETAPKAEVEEPIL